MNPKRRFPRIWRVVGFAAAMLVTGCRVVEETAKLPVKAVTAFVPGTKTSAQNLPLLQLEVERFADDYIGRTTVAIDDYARIVGTPEARSQALLWKLTTSSGAVLIAGGPNPVANLVDMVTATTLARMTVEARAAQRDDRAAFQHWIEAGRILETNVWTMAAGVLQTNQLGELRKAIQEWYEANPGALAFLARTEGLTDLLRKTGAEKRTSSSLFSLVGLDPMAGLDPAVREITLTRLLAERALYIGQRMPFFLRLQMEVFADRTLNLPQIAQTLTNITRLSSAVETASQTAAALPGQIADERKAVLSALEAQEGQLRGLAAEVRETLVAGEKMSTSLNTTLTTFDALMKRFGVGEPRTNAVPDTNSVPFNILDYAKTAEEIAIMAKQVNALVNDARSTVDSTALDKRIADLNVLSQRTSDEAKSVLNHVFLLCGGLVILVFACALGYRRLGSARAAGGSQ